MSPVRPDERRAAPTLAMEFQLALARGGSVIAGLAAALALSDSLPRAAAALAGAWLVDARLRASLLGALPRLRLSDPPDLIDGHGASLWGRSIDAPDTRAAWFRRSITFDRSEWLLLLSWEGGAGGALRLRTRDGVEGAPEAINLDRYAPMLAHAAWQAAPSESAWPMFDDLEGDVLRAVAARVRAPIGLRTTISTSAALLTREGWELTPGRAGSWHQARHGRWEVVQAAIELGGVALIVPGLAISQVHLPHAVPVDPFTAAWVCCYAGGSERPDVLDAPPPHPSPSP